jgi:hypothetical protein
MDKNFIAFMRASFVVSMKEILASFRANPGLISTHLLVHVRSADRIHLLGSHHLFHGDEIPSLVSFHFNMSMMAAR